MEKQEPIYAGSSRVINTKYGEMTTVTFSKDDVNKLDRYMSGNGVEWVTLKIKEKKTKVPNKPTHYLEVDTWKPDGNRKVAEPTNEVPF